MTETSQDLKNQAAELLKQAAALDRATTESDPMAAFAKKLFADAEGDK